MSAIKEEPPKPQTIDQCCNQPEGTFAQFCKDHPDPDAYIVSQLVASIIANEKAAQ